MDKVIIGEDAPYELKEEIACAIQYWLSLKNSGDEMDRALRGIMESLRAPLSHQCATAQCATAHSEKQY